MLLLVLGSVSGVGCGADEPPDRATSEARIRELVVKYNALTAQGDGKAACALVVDQSLEGQPKELLPAGVDDCTSYWTWFGPTMSPAARQLLLDDRANTVAINGEEATATMVSGARLDLKWVDGQWKLGK